MREFAFICGRFPAFGGLRGVKTAKNGSQRGWRGRPEVRSRRSAVSGPKRAENGRNYENREKWAWEEGWRHILGRFLAFGGLRRAYKSDFRPQMDANGREWGPEGGRGRKSEVRGRKTARRFAAGKQEMGMKTGGERAFFFSCFPAWLLVCWPSGRMGLRRGR